MSVNPLLPWVLFGGLLFCACDREPRCDQVARHVRKVAAESDRALVNQAASAASKRRKQAGVSSANPRLLPLCGDCFDTLEATCKKGKLSAKAKRCYLKARTMLALERCKSRT